MSDFKKILIFSTDFRKVTNSTFHQNPSIGSRVVACGQTDVTKLIVAFRNFAKPPKKVNYKQQQLNAVQRHKNTIF